MTTMNWTEYIETQKKRKKYARKKSYLNFEHKIGEYILMCYSSFYNNDNNFFIGISTEPMGYFLPGFDCYPSILTDEQQFEKFSIILKNQILRMEQEDFKSCTNSTFHFDIYSSGCKRVQFYGEKGFVIDRIVGMDISENEHVFDRPKEHKKRIEEIKSIVRLVLPDCV